jgi:hypothetical protein
MAGFNGLLQAEFHPPRYWKLTKELSFNSPELSIDEIQLLQKIGVSCSGDGTITVPVGFETNLASVPRILWSVMAPWDVARAAVIHDRLYWHCVECYSLMIRRNSTELLEVWKPARAISDKVFLLAMQAAEPPISRWKAKAAYRAVRIFGARAARSEEARAEA